MPLSELVVQHVWGHKYIIGGREYRMPQCSSLIVHGKSSTWSANYLLGDVITHSEIVVEELAFQCVTFHAHSAQSSGAFDTLPLLLCTLGEIYILYIVCLLDLMGRDTLLGHKLV